MPDEEYRVCGKCGEEKPEGQFRARRRQCRACDARYSAEWAKKNPEKRRAYQSAYHREYRERKREELAEKAKTRWAANREKYTASKREHYAANRETILAKQREYKRDKEDQAEYFRRYRELNRERVLENQRRWYRENAERVKARVALAQHGGRAGRFIEHSPPTLLYAMVIRKDPCSYCGGPGGTADHVIPVRDGGSLDWSNLTGACRSCNSSKYTSSLLQFLLRKDR